ncbi:MAG: C25 family cysteine peptidase [Candidatus Cloacimonetes bacterium]|nr:C25 family cysteine peptidase [Candidatus Cloacimonadota bacterium]MDD4559421.1 C25 family cysteine peptidase [Candidatus Cloacimonadota bacterium]
MRRLYICLLILLPLVLLANPISVVNENKDTITLKFVMPEYNLTEINVDGLRFKRLMMDDGVSTADEGYPELRMFSVPIAVPIDGGASARLLSSVQNTVTEVLIHPVPTMDLRDEMPVYSSKRDFRAYSKAGMYPTQVLEVSKPAFVGDRRFVTLRIYPFQYNAAGKELRVYQEMEISVNISGTKSPAQNWQLGYSPIDVAGDAFFVNNASSKAWRQLPKQDYQYESPKGSENHVSDIQIIVDSEGIFKVQYSKLRDFIAEMTDSLQVEMSWNIDQVDPRNLELRDEYGQVPIHFHGEEDGSFDNGDFFEFFGDRHYGDERYSDDYTAENVYTLGVTEGYGARMAVENGGLISSNPMEYMLADAYLESVHFEKQLVSDKLGRGWQNSDQEFYREDVWFWEKIKAPNLEIVPIELEYPIDSAVRKGNTEIALHGLTYNDTLSVGQVDHDASIRINQAMVNTHSWIGQTEKIFLNKEPIANSFFHHGTNNVYISLSGNTTMLEKEQVMLDYIKLQYWREYRTDRDFIKFTKPIDRPNGLFQFDIGGFSSPNVSVYKIGSSVFNGLQIEPFTMDGTAPWTVSLQDSVSSNAVLYYAVEEGAKKSPKLLRMNLPSDLKNPMNSANVVVITPYQFMESEGTQMLTDLWSSEGHTVKTVDIQDIYDEFNNGIVSAEAIKDFLTHAYNHWRTPRLSHVILLGEGIDDTRDNSPSRKYNLIPVKKTWTFKHGATASDTWYACIVGDDLVPDISLARINVWTEEQISDYALKAKSYRDNLYTNRQWNNHVTLTAGGKIDDGNDIFSQQSERIRRRSIPEHYRVTRVYTSTQTVSSEYFGGTFDLKDAINSGTQFVQFMGHGGGRVWADYNLFNFNDVATLNNQVLPVVLSLACYASAFDTNGAASISEALIAQPDKGAIVTLGFSGLGYLMQDEDWGHAFSEAAFKMDFDTLGEAYVFALARYYTTTSSAASRYALTNGSVYLGDPLISLNKPIVHNTVVTQNHNPEPGESLSVQAQFPADVARARMYIMNENETVKNVPYDIDLVSGEFLSNYEIPQGSSNYTNKIMVSGYSPAKQYIGTTFYSVGRPAVKHEGFIPAQPVYTDSTVFMARVFNPQDIMSLYVAVRTDSVYYPKTQTWEVLWENYSMSPDAEDNTLWKTDTKLRKFPTKREIPFKYYITDKDTLVFESPLQSFHVAGPDLFLQEILLDANDGIPVLKVKSTNVGNAASLTTDLRLFKRVRDVWIMVSEQDFAPLDVEEYRWDTISLEDLPNGNHQLEVRVNTTFVFQEWDFFVNTNNYIPIEIPMNYFSVDSGGASINSLDNNLTCTVPPGFVNSGSVGFAVNDLDNIQLLNQPDLQTILMQNPAEGSDLQLSIPYEIKLLNTSLVDSLGFFDNGKKLNLTFKYSSNDDDTQDFESEYSFKIYRYNTDYQKWILVGGHMDLSNDTVSFEVARQGTYCIFRNTDNTPPTIEVNVQDQEFTVGGYVAGDGVISLLLSDANGIDLIDNRIHLSLNGSEIPETDYVISINKENINRVPVKYQLDLQKGDHNLKVVCTDLNGNVMSREAQFIVNDEFNILNIANYPNPVLGQAQDPKNDGRTRFTYVLTDSADEVYIKVYTISGRLVKTFRDLPTGVGYHEYPRTLYAWDCRDEQGFLLANGTYFYRVVARRGNKKIEKTMKMAILR